MVAVGGVADCSDCQDNLADDVDDAHIEDGLEHAQEGVGQNGAESWREVAERREGVVEHGGSAVAIAQEPEVETQDTWN